MLVRGIIATARHGRISVSVSDEIIIGIRGRERDAFRFSSERRDVWYVRMIGHVLRIIDRVAEPSAKF